MYVCMYVLCMHPLNPGSHSRAVALYQFSILIVVVVVVDNDDMFRGPGALRGSRGFGNRVCSPLFGSHQSINPSQPASHWKKKVSTGFPSVLKRKPSAQRQPTPPLPCTDTYQWDRFCQASTPRNQRIRVHMHNHYSGCHAD
ncbi:hypothetical protein LZ32DRAFT_194650 [Colletotrichum eremochloae]|nr:hypothetical protein LZ32DRAFT_194650 [Colletotrichum eremochloae]